MADAKFDEYGNKIINETGDITFKCPACGEIEISRSKNAKGRGKGYECPKCKFVGP